MKHAVTVLALLLLFGCVSQQPVKSPDSLSNNSPNNSRNAAFRGITYKGGDGSSIEKAVIILGAPNSIVGVSAESAWIRKNHPGWRKKRQSLMGNKDKNYDCIEYTTPDGKTKTIYFDITDFFGKF